MVLSERNERAVYLVTQTNKFLDDLIGKVRGRAAAASVTPALLIVSGGRCW
jgi:hypothetical protein